MIINIPKAVPKVNVYFTLNAPGVPESGTWGAKKGVNCS